MYMDETNNVRCFSLKMLFVYVDPKLSSILTFVTDVQWNYHQSQVFFHNGRRKRVQLSGGATNNEVCLFYHFKFESAMYVTS